MTELLFMVEMMGVEPMSENRFPKPSTSVVYLLSFPWRSADKQAFLLGSPLIRDKVQGYSLFTCTTKMTPLSGPWFSREGWQLT